MKLRINISCDNSAFDDDPTLEVARILRDLAVRLVNEGPMLNDFTLRDVNGNTVGEARVVK